MKRALSLLLALALLLTTFAGCRKQPPADDAEDTSAYELLYAPVLKKYKQAFDENWPREKFMETGLSPQLAALEKTAEPAFAFLDLDGDKTPELFIGRTDQSSKVYDLYTAQEDSHTIKRLTVPAEETVLTLTDDRRLVEQNTSYESLEIVTYYELENAALTPTDSYIHDADLIVDGENEWYHRTGILPEDETEFYADDMDVITEAEYIEKTAYQLGSLLVKLFADLVLPEIDDIATSEDTDASEQNDLAALGETVYASALDDYRARALETGSWFGGYSALSSGTPGYAFIDLDHDGTPELAVCGQPGLNEPAAVVDLYAVNNGAPKMLVNAAEVWSMDICTDERIVYYMPDNYYAFFTISDGKLQLDEIYSVEYNGSSESYFYTSTDANIVSSDGTFNWDWMYDTDQMQPISGAEFRSGIDYDVMNLEITPFAVTDAGSPQQEAYQSVMQAAKNALTDAGSHLEYAVYDIDEDGTEELILLDKYHGFNATGNYRFYSYRNGVAVYLGYLDWNDSYLLIEGQKIYSMSDWSGSDSVVIRDGRLFWDNESEPTGAGRRVSFTSF